MVWEVKRVDGMEGKKATTAGFELARAKPNRFLVCLLNHSDKLSWFSFLHNPTSTSHSLIPQSPFKNRSMNLRLDSAVPFPLHSIRL